MKVADGRTPSCLPGLVVQVCQQCCGGAACRAPATGAEGGPRGRGRHRGRRRSRARLAGRRPRDGLPHPDARRLGVRGDRRAGGTSRRSAARPSRRRRPLGDDGAGLHGVLDARPDLGRGGDRARGGGPHARGRRLERLAARARAGRRARRRLRRGVERRRHGPDVDRDLRRRAGARRPVAAERAHPRAAEPLGAAGRRRRGRRARRTSRPYGGRVAVAGRTGAAASPARPTAVGCERAVARRPAPLQPHHQAGARAPHGERQRLPARRRARADPGDVPLPHALPGLVRHRLQLPRRPVRPDLDRPRRRLGPARARRPHAGLQRDVGRRRRDRELRARPPRRRGPRRGRRRRRVEAAPVRPRPEGQRPRPVGGERPVPPRPQGPAAHHRRPPRHQPDRLPRPPPLPPPPRDPAARRRADPALLQGAAGLAADAVRHAHPREHPERRPGFVRALGRRALVRLAPGRQEDPAGVGSGVRRAAGRRRHPPVRPHHRPPPRPQAPEAEALDRPSGEWTVVGVGLRPRARRSPTPRLRPGRLTARRAPGGERQGRRQARGAPRRRPPVRRSRCGDVRRDPPAAAGEVPGAGEVQGRPLPRDVPRRARGCACAADPYGPTPGRCPMCAWARVVHAACGRTRGQSRGRAAPLLGQRQG